MGHKTWKLIQLGMKPILFQVVYSLQTFAHVSFLILDVFFAFKHPTCELVSLLAHFWICRGFGFLALRKVWFSSFWSFGFFFQVLRFQLA
jgi:hypothetical protein